MRSCGCAAPGTTVTRSGWIWKSSKREDWLNVTGCIKLRLWLPAPNICLALWWFTQTQFHSQLVDCLSPHPSIHPFAMITWLFDHKYSRVLSISEQSIPPILVQTQIQFLDAWWWLSHPYFRSVDISWWLFIVADSLSQEAPSTWCCGNLAGWHSMDTEPAPPFSPNLKWNFNTLLVPWKWRSSPRSFLPTIWIPMGKERKKERRKSETQPKVGGGFWNWSVVKTIQILLKNQPEAARSSQLEVIQMPGIKSTQVHFPQQFLAVSSCGSIRRIAGGRRE